jgi:hypothetical protein
MTCTLGGNMKAALPTAFDLSGNIHRAGWRAIGRHCGIRDLLSLALRSFAPPLKEPT